MASYKEKIQKSYIGFAVLWVGTKCSLRCRDCGNLIPFSGQESYKMDVIISDLKKLLEICKVDKLQIQGGEPFTHPDIDMLITVIDELDIPEIVITTNGTINIKQSTIDLIKKVEHSNFSIIISTYNCVKEKQVKLYERLKSNGINVILYNFFNNDNKWVRLGDIIADQNDDTEIIKEKYKSCDFKICATLADGWLYRCGRGKVIIEVLGLEYGAFDCLNLRNISCSSQGAGMIREFIENKEPKVYCKYCLGTANSEKVIPAIQL